MRGLHRGHRRRRSWHLALAAVTALVLSLLILASGCTTGRPRPEAIATLSEEEQALADRLYSQLVQEQALHRDRRVLELAFELVDHYPLYSRNDEVTLRAITSAQRLGDLGTGRELTSKFLATYPDSPLQGDVLARGTELAVAAADTAAAAELLLRRYDASADADERDEIAQQAQIYLPPLGAADLDTLIQRYPVSGLRPYASYLLTERLAAEGRTADAESAVRALAATAPEDEWLAAAERLLVQPGYRQGGTPLRLRGAAATPDLLAVLCPLTGRYAVLGNAFYDGVLLAVGMINGQSRRQFEVRVEDTAGDPVTAAIAARKLATEDGPIAIVGAMLSDPTVAAAIVADTYGIPLVSPTATNERVWELGPAVFQTNLSGQYEIGLLVQLATRLLLKERFAVLYADTREGAQSYQAFAEEINTYGGTIVGAAAFSPEATDFREPILELKQHRPEVVFIPASVDQMILLGPQLDFYRLGALIMGLSNWNSPRLFQQASSGLNRILFPSDTLLFPPEWTEFFNREWQPEHVPPEATPLAQKAFQATAVVLDILTREGVETRRELAATLAERLQVPQLESAGPWRYATAVRMAAEGEIEPFPADLFLETWEAAAADSTSELPESPADADGPPTPESDDIRSGPPNGGGFQDDDTAPR